MKELAIIAEELKKLNHNLLQFLNMQGHEVKDSVDDVLGAFNAYTRNEVTKEEFIKVLEACEAYELQPDGRELVSMTNLPCVFGYYVNFANEKMNARLNTLFGEETHETKEERVKVELPEKCPLKFRKKANTSDLANAVSSLNRKFGTNAPYRAVLDSVQDAHIQTITIGHNRHFKVVDAEKIYKIFKLFV